MAAALLAVALPFAVHASSTPEEPEIEHGIVRLGRQAVLTLNAPGPGGISAQDRAALVEARLKKALDDPEVGPEDFLYEGREDRFAIRAGPYLLLAAGPLDAEATGESVEALARRWTGRLRVEFAQAKQTDFTLRLLTRYLLALLYPLGLVIVLVLLRGLRRAGLLWIYKIDDERPSPMRLGKYELVSLKTVKGVLRFAFTAFVWALIVAAAYGFLLAMFYYFPVTRQYAERMSQVLYEIFFRMGAVFFGHFVRFAVICLIAFLCWLIVEFWDRVFDDVVAGKLKLQPYVTPENADTVEYLVKGVTLVTALVMMVIVLPGEGGQLATGVLVLIGVAVAFASVPILRNLLDGFVLAFLSTHRRGVRIKIDGREAMVMRRGLLFTTVRYPDGKSGRIPNETVLHRPVFRERSEDLVAWRGRMTVPEKTKLTEFQEALEGWVSEWEEDAQIRITAIVDGVAHFELLVPFLTSTSEVFVPVVYDGLSEMTREHGVRVLDLAPFH